MRWLVAGLTLLAMSACAPQVIDASPRGGAVIHVITVGPFHNTDEAFQLADASCRRYGRTAHMIVPITALGGGDASLAFDCVRPQ